MSVIFKNNNSSLFGSASAREDVGSKIKELEEKVAELRRAVFNPQEDNNDVATEEYTPRNLLSRVYVLEQQVDSLQEQIKSLEDQLKTLKDSLDSYLSLPPVPAPIAQASSPAQPAGNEYFSEKVLEGLRGLLKSLGSPQAQQDLPEYINQMIAQLRQELVQPCHDNSFYEDVRTSRLPQLFISICEHAQRTNKKHIISNMVGKHFTVFKTLGMSVIYPNSESQIDGQLHDCVEAVSSRDYKLRGHIADCLCPGIMVDGCVYAPAKVAIYS